MVHLDGLEPDALAQVAEIARANPMSKGFLDQILTELRRAGLVHSKHGKHGGYALARPAGDIVVGSVVRVLDGPLAPIRCASVTAYHACDDCADLRACAEGTAPAGGHVRYLSEESRPESSGAGRAPRLAAGRWARFRFSPNASGATCRTVARAGRGQSATSGKKIKDGEIGA
jgi:Rrf2 family protein